MRNDPFRAAILGGMSLNLRPRRTFYYTEGREFEHLPRFIDVKIVDTLKRMAEIVAVYRLLSGEKIFASVPYRERFKAVLESYDTYTLKKNRMRRRKIKLADLI